MTLTFVQLLIHVVVIDTQKNCKKAGYLCDEYSESSAHWKGWTSSTDPTCMAVAAPAQCLFNGVVKTRDTTECNKLYFISIGINVTTGNCVTIGPTNCINNDTLKTCVSHDSDLFFQCLPKDNSVCINSATRLTEKTSKTNCIHEETGLCKPIGPESTDYGIMGPLNFICVDVTPADKCLDILAQLVITMSEDGLCKGGANTNTMGCHAVTSETNFAKHSASHQCVETSDLRGSPPILCRVWDGTKCTECDSTAELKAYGSKCEVIDTKDKCQCDSLALKFDLISSLLMGALALNLF